MRHSDRPEAVQFRRDGATYEEIMHRLGVAKSTLWRWLKAEGLVDGQSQHYTERRLLAQRKAVVDVRGRRLQRTQAIVEQAKQEIGLLTPRDLLMIGTALYWAEGSKQKSHNVSQRVQFANSDPAMLRVFLLWLREICQVSIDQLTFELYIHELASVETAQRFWSLTLQIPVERFRVRLKRHKLSPRRRNVGGGYVGLVRITVSQSVDLNRKVSGWIEGLCQLTGESANGKPSDFGSEYPGSIPGSPAACARSDMKEIP